MASSLHVGWLFNRLGLDRYLLREQYRLPNPSHWGLEYGDWLWLYCGWLQPRHEVALEKSDQVALIHS